MDELITRFKVLIEKEGSELELNIELKQEYQFTEDIK